MKEIRLDLQASGNREEDVGKETFGAKIAVVSQKRTEGKQK